MIIQKTVSSRKNAPSVHLQNTALFTDVENSLLGSNASMDDELEFQGVSSRFPSITENDSKPPKKIKISERDSSKFSQRK